MTRLIEKKCVPCEGGVPALPLDQVLELLQAELASWQLDKTTPAIFRRFEFKNFYKTMAFVNAIAWIANQENHHPDLSVGYNYCLVNLTTHAVSGLTENDFIIAAKIDRLLQA